MNQKQIDEIRAREIETPPGPWVNRQDVPDLLDALEEAQKKIELQRIHLAKLGKQYNEAIDWGNALRGRLSKYEPYQTHPARGSRRLDALEEVQAENERLQNTIQAKASTIELRKSEIEVFEREVERLREALRLAEQKCRHLIGTKTADHHIAVLEECRVCGAQFSSATPTQGQPHRDDCPFKALEGTNDESRTD